MPAETVFSANGLRPHGGIVAFTLNDLDGKVRLEPAWASRDMTSPLTPVAFSGVVFAALVDRRWARLGP